LSASRRSRRRASVAASSFVVRGGRPGGTRAASGTTSIRAQALRSAGVFFVDMLCLVSQLDRAVASSCFRRLREALGDIPQLTVVC